MRYKADGFKAEGRGQKLDVLHPIENRYKTWLKSLLKAAKG
jgi:hypothetical protein